ncbi:hypothetical protein CDD80_586 [Ophiocordyceps camponoti-rufipedis]|uniref:PHD-type domain-containing protein n=1 Tax=Ophiocordyceps camponoti-rufipedis TaxID=2004952 RepID=A0A2C5YJP6_9HYPO|nr:hypothetical protein CDD80_586 [Ophiocordyceps camponoti-rufipedis]
MISSNTRASRSASRYSSPAQPGWGASEGSRALMARWLEPSVQSKTSFEEAGLMRHGVLETMAPLGSMPKSKRKDEGVRKIILRPSEKPSPCSGETAVTKKTEENKEDKEDKMHKKDKKDKKNKNDTKDEDEKHDQGQQNHEAGTSTRRRRSTRASLPSRKLRRAAESAEESVIMAKTPPPPVKKRPDPDERDFTDKVVEAAVDEALRHYRYPTAWALRTLYDERCEDGDFVTMMDDVYRQTADAETRADFARLIEAKKREGKRDNQGCYYFVPPTTNSRFTPHKPRPAPYAVLLRAGEGEAEADEDEDEVDEDEVDEDEGDADDQDDDDDDDDNRDDKEPKHKPLATTTTTTTTPSTPDGAVVMVRTPRSSRLGRRVSASSLSSLSSAMSLSSPEAADAPKRQQPITTRNASESNSPPSLRRTRAARDKDNSMLLDPDAKPKRRRHHNGQDDAVKRPNHDESDDDDDDDNDNDDDAFSSWHRRRRHARRVTNGYSVRESAVRVVTTTPVTAITTPPPRPSRRPRRVAPRPAPTTRATRSAGKRPAPEPDRLVSPAAFSWQGDGSPTAGSRAVTPATSLRPAKRQRTGLRVKTSPVKKKGGTAAGVPRPVGEPGSTLGGGGAPKDHTSDNDEYCSACGNAGDVVCCDGCPRSFHFECVDMVQSDHLPDEWFCNECLIRRFPSRVPVHQGIFASALNNLEKCIPRAFSLPVKVQNRFEGVKAGADGDYEEVVPTKAAAKKRPGYDELPDFFKQRDDGRAVLCHACQKPATEIRAIITCSACPFHWHIDCLDPPLAVPPVLKSWRCPAHIDDVLVDVPRLAPAHRFRTIRGSQPLTPALSRGLRNNGHIDIDWSDEADASGWPDASSFGRTYKLASNGVILDFIEQLRHQGAGFGPRRHESRRVPYPVPSVAGDKRPLVGSALERKMDEMQVSLNLIGLREKPTERIGQLTSALLSAADDNVLALMAKANADNLAAARLGPSDRQGLRALLAQTDAMAARIRSLLDAPPPTTKPDAAAPVAEPTPPSTVDHAEGSMDLD